MQSPGLRPRSLVDTLNTVESSPEVKVFVIKGLRYALSEGYDSSGIGLE